MNEKNIISQIQIVSITDLKEYENNPRFNDNAVEAVANSIEQFGFKVPLIIDKNNVIVCGHTRLKAAKKLGLENVPCIVADDLSEEQINAFRLADNKTAELAEWDFEKLEAELDLINDIDMDMFGFDVADLQFENDDNSGNEQHRNLAEKFIAPPFSILDTRQGYWQERKKEWKDKINDNGDRGTSTMFASMSKINDTSFADNSIIDPVLCEILLKWFAPYASSKTFDCFAGDTGFGFVSAYLGHQFTGIELREEQCEDNLRRINDAGLSANYICDDGRNIQNHIEKNSQDMFFSCLPYFDLEVYSDKENDASNQGSYEEFYEILDTAFTNASECLKENRFAVVVCGDIRNKKTGEYYGFMDDIKATFKRNGFKLWNELILVEAIGNRRLLANKYMETRKVAKTHQNILVFYKGDGKQIKNEFNEIEEWNDESEDME